MDYLIVLFLSVLSPVALHLSNVEYTTEMGISFSDPVYVNSQKATPISTGNDKTDFDVLYQNYFGNYGILYEAFIDYKFYIADNTWLALRSAYSPFREGSTVTVKPDLSPNPATVAYFYTEHPSFGLLAGYDLKYGISPYVGVSFLHIAYAGYGNFELEEQFDSTLVYTAGLRYKLDANWSGIAEFSGYKFAMRYIQGQTYDINMRIMKYKLGVVYAFAKPKELRENNKTDQYKDILHSLDPTLDEKIEADRKKEEEQQKELMKKQKEQEKLNQQLQAELNKKAKAEQTKQDELNAIAAKEAAAKAKQDKKMQEAQAKKNPAKVVAEPKKKASTPKDTTKVKEQLKEPSKDLRLPQSAPSSIDDSLF